jgi:hypothetical protein
MKRCDETSVISWKKPNIMVEPVALVLNATSVSWIAVLLAQTFHYLIVRVAAQSPSGETVVHSQTQDIIVAEM